MPRVTKKRKAAKGTPGSKGSKKPALLPGVVAGPSRGCTVEETPILGTPVPPPTEEQPAAAMPGETPILESPVPPPTEEQPAAAMPGVQVKTVEHVGLSSGKVKITAEEAEEFILPEFLLSSSEEGEEEEIPHVPSELGPMGMGAEPAAPPTLSTSAPAGAAEASSKSGLNMNSAGQTMAAGLLEEFGKKKLTVEAPSIERIPPSEREALFPQLGGPEELLTTAKEIETYSRLVKAATAPGATPQAMKELSEFKIGIVTAHLATFHSQSSTMNKTQPPTTTLPRRINAYNLMAERKLALLAMAKQEGEGSYMNASWPSRHELWYLIAPLCNKKVPNHEKFLRFWAGRVNAGYLAFTKKLHGEITERLLEANFKSEFIPTENAMKTKMAPTLNAAFKARHLHPFVFPPPEKLPLSEFIIAAESQVRAEKNLPLTEPVAIAEVLLVAQKLQMAAFEKNAAKHAGPSAPPQIVNPANPGTKVTIEMLERSILLPEYWKTGATPRMQPSYPEPLRAALLHFNEEAAQNEVSGTFMRKTLKKAMELLFESRFQEMSLNTGFNLFESMRHKAVSTKIKALHASWLKPIVSAAPPALSAAPESNAEQLATKEAKKAKLLN